MGIVVGIIFAIFVAGSWYDEHTENVALQNQIAYFTASANTLDGMPIKNLADHQGSQS